MLDRGENDTECDVVCVGVEVTDGKAERIEVGVKAEHNVCTLPFNLDFSINVLIVTVSGTNIGN